MEAHDYFEGSWFVRLFRTPKIKNTALEELLEYKSKLNAQLLKSDMDKIDMNGNLK